MHLSVGHHIIPQKVLLFFTDCPVECQSDVLHILLGCNCRCIFQSAICQPRSFKHGTHFFRLSYVKLWEFYEHKKTFNCLICYVFGDLCNAKHIYLLHMFLEILCNAYWISLGCLICPGCYWETGFVKVIANCNLFRDQTNLDDSSEIRFGFLKGQCCNLFLSNLDLYLFCGFDCYLVLKGTHLRYPWTCLLEYLREKCCFKTKEMFFMHSLVVKVLQRDGTCM